MNETIIIILIAFGIGNQIEKQKPEEILFENSDGSLVSTLIHKGNYYCPIYCSTDHKHFSHKKEKKCNCFMDKRKKKPVPLYEYLNDNSCHC